MIGVVDTSALIRMYIPDGPLPDGLSEFFQGVERGFNSAVAPELLVVETANVINKKRKSGELSDDESDRLLADILSVPIRLFPHTPLLSRACELTREFNLTVYDTLYLSLAEDRGAVIFSADNQLMKIAARLHLL